MKEFKSYALLSEASIRSSGTEIVEGVGNGGLTGRGGGKTVDDDGVEGKVSVVGPHGRRLDGDEVGVKSSRRCARYEAGV